MSVWNTRLKATLGPAQPVNSQVPWDRSIEEIGIAFPEDFREFVDTYGSVTINKLLHIPSPQRQPRRFTEPEGIVGFAHYVWFSSINGGQGQLRDRIRTRWPKTQPYPIWPEAGGLILWGWNERHHRAVCGLGLQAEEAEVADRREPGRTQMLEYAAAAGRGDIVAAPRARRRDPHQAAFLVGQREEVQAAASVFARAPRGRRRSAAAAFKIRALRLHLHKSTPTLPSPADRGRCQYSITDTNPPGLVACSA